MSTPLLSVYLSVTFHLVNSCPSSLSPLSVYDSDQSLSFSSRPLLVYPSQWFCVCPPVMAENFILFCFCRWLQNHTRTTFFLSSSFSAIWAIFSPDGRGCTAKYASRERFSGAAIEVRFRFLSAAELKISGVFWFSLLCRSASSSHAWSTGLSAIMLL